MEQINSVVIKEGVTLNFSKEILQKVSFPRPRIELRSLMWQVSILSLAHQAIHWEWHSNQAL